MYYLAEDPTLLAGGLAAVGVGLLVALKVTQQGKFLIGAVVALGLALAVVGVERLWVTDNERIEAVVYDLADAVQASDADRAMTCLTPDCRLEVGLVGTDDAGLFRKAMLLALRHMANRRVTPELMKGLLEPIRFDFVRITKLTANAGAQSRQGTAIFRAYASGTRTDPGSGIAYNFSTPTSGTDWSLGVRETAPGVWKVDRISPTNLNPAEFLADPSR
jgi:hypothetical protein